MSVTRRSFLERAAVTVLAAAVLPKVFSQSGHVTSAATFSEDQLPFFDGITADTFRPHIGGEFKVSSKRGSLGTLILIAVAESNPAKPSATNKPMVGAIPKPSTQAADVFQLTFRGSGAQLPQETYTLTNLSLGSFPLFLVPDTIVGSSPHYVAIFNLLKS